ncbi:MAG: hypothetical protein Q8Q92_04355 [bacterium]|nr:hypothetical protein [bacterium]
MTIFLIIVACTLVTFFLGYLAYKHWGVSVPKSKRTKFKPAMPPPTGTPTPPTKPRLKISKKVRYSVATLLAVAIGAGIFKRLPPPAPPTTVATTTFKIVVTKEWSEPIQLPTGRRVDWMPESAVTYEIMTEDKEIVRFPAVTRPLIEVRSSLYPWFKFRAVDADSVVINIVTQPSR